MLRILSRPLRAVAVLLLGVLLAVAGAWIILAQIGSVPGVALSVEGMDLLIDPASGPLLQWVGAGLVLLLLGLAVALLSMVPDGASDPSSVILAAPDSTALALPGTTVTMSTRSLHSLVAWLASQCDGVRNVVPNVRLGESGWEVHCRVGLWATTSIPVVSDELRTRLGHDLLHHTGIGMDRLQLDFDYGSRADSAERVR